MSLKNRPFIGGWQMNRTLVRHSPDAVVFINGYQELAVCPVCNNLLDFQKYITQMSVDAGTEGISSANLTLSIPRHDVNVFGFDGNYILQPSLEVMIFLRGYFPMKGYAGEGQTTEDQQEFNASEVPVYPYYQVFRGVVTNVTHDFNAGFYTATLQCANLLHFWQNLYLSVNGAVMGPRPDNSMVEPSVVGHKFTGTNPYSIIYTLVKVGFGAAYGVEFVLNKKANVATMDDNQGKSLYKHAAEWWEKRWTERSGNLRMYGINGTLFNAAEQAYLGAWFDTKETSGSPFYKTAKRLYETQTGKHDFNTGRSSEILKAARELGFDPLATRAAIYNKDGVNASEDILRLQAFNLDIGKVGSINMFETEYMSKMEISEAVKTITGYEFYQDVDGDLVFKPPMYNMDTRSDPVYRIADRDLRSISETETEPEATMMKGTGSSASNVSGLGMDGWLGTGAMFIDYRLVAKYGYREATFESNYMSDRQALYLSAINRLDLANIGTKSCSISIPLRPELRPGYPVYVEHLDCFYYISSLSHSFQYGSQCTTTISGVAKRSKWLPPMDAAHDGDFPTTSQIRLDAPGEYPAQPLFGYPQSMWSSGEAVSGPPRVYGFPNVIMALDAEKVNLFTVDVDTGLITLDSFLYMVLNSGFLERSDTKDTFILRTSNSEGSQITLTALQQQWSDATATDTIQADPSNEIGKLVQAIQARENGVDLNNSSALVNYLTLQTNLKGLFAPGMSTQGGYRYFSCSHSEEQHQGPTCLRVDQEAGKISTESPGVPDEGFTQSSFVITDAGNGKGISTEMRDVKRGIRVAAFSQKGDNAGSVQVDVMATSDVRFVTFSPQTIRKQIQVTSGTDGQNKGVGAAFPAKSTQEAFKSLLCTRQDSDQSKTVSERFEDEYLRLLACIEGLAIDIAVAADPRVTAAWGKASSVEEALSNYPPHSTYPSSVTTGGVLEIDEDGNEGRTRTVATTVTRSQTLPGEAADMTIFEINEDYKGYNAGDWAAMTKLAGYLSKALWVYLSTTFRVYVSGKARGDSYDAFLEARNKFIYAYTDGQVEASDSNPGVFYLQVTSYSEKNDFTPVFPVSDSQGYEVVGNLPYGRGITIEKYAELLETSTSGDTTDSPTEASESSETRVGTYGGTNAASLLAVEKFLIGYLIGKDPQKAFAGLSTEEQAAVLAASNTTADNLQGAVESLTYKDTSQAAHIRNTPVTSFNRGQSLSGDASAVNLANLDAGESVCVCRGVDAGFLLEAFSADFLEAYPEDPVQGYIGEQAQASSQAWEESRQALSGSVLDTRNTNLAQEFTSEGNLASSLTNNTQGALNQLSQASDAARQAAEDLLDGE
jgi:hypothetical protein